MEDNVSRSNITTIFEQFASARNTCYVAFQQIAVNGTEPLSLIDWDILVVTFVYTPKFPKISTRLLFWVVYPFLKKARWLTKISVLSYLGARVSKKPVICKNG